MKLLLTLMLLTNIVLADYDEGIEYIALKKPVATLNDDNVEVREIFWYQCPYCYNLKPTLNSWLKNKPDNVDFIADPVMFSDRTELGAIQHYTLLELELIDKLHLPLFNAIHKNGRTFTKDSFATWVAQNSDFSKQQVLKTVNSFNVRIKVNQSAVRTHKYQVTGVPSIVVNGKYITSATLAGSNAEMLKVVNFLIAKETEQQQKVN